MHGQSDIEVNVDRKELLGILQENREEHYAEYEKAKQGFRILLQKELEKKLEQCKTGKKVELSFKNHKPDNHLDDFDDIIGLLKLTESSTVSVGMDEYKRYYKNEWDWKRYWHSSNVMYLSAAQ